MCLRRPFEALKQAREISYYIDLQYSICNFHISVTEAAMSELMLY